ncbi:MAG: EAL domain-containing protein [Myxococcales bacterium]|nr:EAL domain-containing protein [Myxococcales bacterium]
MRDLARPEQGSPSASAEPAPGPLRSLGEATAEIELRFVEAGAAALVLIQSPDLAQIEIRDGREAALCCFQELAELVERAAAPVLEPGDLVLAGESGRAELLVLLFRSRRDGEFFRVGVPGLLTAIREGFERRSGPLFYPWLRCASPVALGSGTALRNPRLGTSTQLRRAIEEARSDAELAAGLAARKRRQELLEIVIDERVHCVYEPIVDTESLTAFGYEALARGPAGSGLESPTNLFRLAELEDLTFDLDCLCRKQALEGAIEFPEGAKLFLNIRPSSFHDPSFQPDAICETLARCRLTPRDVVFEISEQESIHNFSLFRGMRDDYGRLGFEFALDDTGTGYASFQTLLELTPEFVKVDRALVAGIDEDPAKRAILYGFQSIADRIGARLVGEGLDTLEELRTLGKLGIPFGQGWLFGKPTPLRSPK